jgi:hypothetical protein
MSSAWLAAMIVLGGPTALFIALKLVERMLWGDPED